ncbi:oxidoreductase, molybdopterin-binding subunit [Xanthomonas arboricola pv. pruni str. MAFF 311562]|uniref:Oxidoreductase, molybdopterin-binding subunit n=1 Tax=Xanthomonas arboricola pv. pruni str. MAFF 311562 TaxID=1414836 RepID=W4S7K0_9XANT|nr:oxidoreductase, molybdopterin-binding subunit [Xanthomonas arboricola pv. pruni str. MAFF 311562]
MIPLTYTRADSVDAALTALSVRGSDPHPVPAEAPVRLIAGGTNLTDLMKLQLMRPGSLVDINRLPLDGISALPEGGLRLGALARNADTAYHPDVETRYPLLSAAILAGASPQIRNMASNGGNLLQRTRCLYFYDHATPCNKRAPGTGCSAIGGLTTYNAILGASVQCIATHPSDMCVALAALDAVVHVRGPNGERDIPFAQFHRLPGEHPELDSTLARDELIVHIDLPDAQRFVAHSAYLKIRERLSYAFALVSVAAALDLAEDGSIREVRVALGGVAHKPGAIPTPKRSWRANRPRPRASAAWPMPCCRVRNRKATTPSSYRWHAARSCVPWTSPARAPSTTAGEPARWRKRHERTQHRSTRQRPDPAGCRQRHRLSPHRHRRHPHRRTRQGHRPGTLCRRMAGGGSGLWCGGQQQHRQGRDRRFPS